MPTSWSDRLCLENRTTAWTPTAWGNSASASSTSISQAQRIDVWSWTDGGAPKHVFIDISDPEWVKAAKIRPADDTPLPAHLIARSNVFGGAVGPCFVVKAGPPHVGQSILLVRKRTAFGWEDAVIG